MPCTHRSRPDSPRSSIWSATRAAAGRSGRSAWSPGCPAGWSRSCRRCGWRRRAVSSPVRVWRGLPIWWRRDGRDRGARCRVRSHGGRAARRWTPQSTPHAPGPARAQLAMARQPARAGEPSAGSGGARRRRGRGVPCAGRRVARRRTGSEGADHGGRRVAGPVRAGRPGGVGRWRRSRDAPRHGAAAGCGRAGGGLSRVGGHRANRGTAIAGRRRRGGRLARRGRGTAGGAEPTRYGPHHGTAARGASGRHAGAALRRRGGGGRVPCLVNPRAGVPRGSARTRPDRLVVGRSAGQIGDEVDMGAVSVLAVVCAAAAGWLLLSPRPGSSRVRKIEMASVPRAEPVRATIAGSPDRGGRPARGVGSSAPARGAAALLAGLALAGMIGGVAGTAVGVVGAVTAWVFLGRLEPAGVVRGRRRQGDAVPLAADLLAAGLAAGSPPDRVAEAVGQAVGGPLGERLCQGATALRLGAEPVDAWSPLLADPASRPLGRALAGAVTRG